MDFNKSSDIVKKRAHLVFQLRSARMAIVALAIMLCMTYLMTALFVGKILALKISVLFAVSFAISTIINKFSSKIMSVRRSLWSSLLVLSPEALAVITTAPFDLWNKALPVLTYTSTYLSLLVGLSLYRSKMSKILSTIPPLIPNAICPSYILLVSLTLAIFTIKLTDVVVDRISSMGHCRGLSIGRVVAELLLSSDPTELESVLTERSIEDEIRITCVRMRSVALISADIHPGPYKAGSSRAPRLIMEHLDKEGVSSVFLRRASTHTRNLPSESEVRRVADRVASLVRGGKNVDTGELVWMKRGPFEITAQAFGSTVLATVSGRGLESFEDIPNSTDRRVNEVMRAKGLDVSVVVVDRHDCLTPGGYSKVDPFSPEEDELVRYIVEVVEKALASKRSSLIRVGFSKLHLDLDSLGEGGIRVIVLEVGGNKAAYICVDSNNMLPKMRDLITNEVASLGITPIVITTDTHETMTVRKTDNPFGYECNEDEMKKIASKIRKLVREASRSLVECRAAINSSKISCRIVGEEVMDDIFWKIERANYAPYLIGLAVVPVQLALLVSALI